MVPEGMVGEFDDLTRLPGRGILHHSLDAAIVAATEGAPCCLLAVDLDYLKLFNDHYGHQAGDAALRAVASVLQATLRPADVRCRYGGDEFLVLLPATDLAMGMLIAERLRAAAAHATAVSGQGIRLQLTLSIGVASCPADLPSTSDGALSVERLRALLIAAADRGTYAAKAAGRNAVRHWHAAPEEADPRPAASQIRPEQQRLIGRHTEIARLRALLEAAAGGRGGLALLEGEAGIGKSRLASEAASLARVLGVRVLSARCYQVEMNSPYAPLLEALAPLVEQTPLTMLRQAAGPWAGEVARLLPLLGQKLPEALPLPPLPPNEDRGRLQEALCSFVLGLADRPTLLLIDDMHWFDDASIRALHRLARQLRQAPLLVLGTVRTDDSQAHATLWQALGALQHQGFLDERILVPRLSSLEMDSLLRGTVGPDDRIDGLRERLLLETAGNPLFLLETIRLLAEGVTVPGQAGERASGRAALPLAPTVRAAIAARLVGLSRPQTDLLEAAAVLGRACTLEELRGVSGLDEEQLLIALDQLEGRAVLTTSAVGVLTRCDLTHPQIGEVAYQAMTVSRRRLFHRRAARVLAAAAPPPGTPRPPGLIEPADHYWQAGEPAAALPLFVQAGEEAVRLHATEEAVRCYERALLAVEAIGPASVPDDPHAPAIGPQRLHERLGDLRAVSGAWSGAVVSYRTARDALVAGDRAPGAPDHLARAAELWRREGEVEALRGQYAAALAAFDHADRPDIPGPSTISGLPNRANSPIIPHAVPPPANSAYREGWAWARSGRRRGLSSPPSSLPATLQASVAVSRGLVLARQGDRGAAATAAAHALVLLGGGHAVDGSTTGRPYDGAAAPVLAQAHLLLGDLAFERADYAYADTCFRRSLALRERLADEPGIATCILRLGDVAQQQDALATAQDRYRQALQISERVGEPYAVAGCLYALGLASFRRDAPAQAEEYLERSLQIGERLGDLHGMGRCTVALGRLADTQGDGGRALRLFRGARRLARQGGHLALAREASARLALALLASPPPGSPGTPPARRATQLAAALLARVRAAVPPGNDPLASLLSQVEEAVQVSALGVSRQ